MTDNKNFWNSFLKDNGFTVTGRKIYSDRLTPTYAEARGRINHIENYTEN